MTVARRKAKEDERAAERRRYDERISNAWKAPGPAFGFVGLRPSDPDWQFYQALLAWLNRADIAPLLDLVESDHPLSRLMRGYIAGLMRILYARSQPRKEGKPGGTYTRWQDPRYLVAWLTEQYMNAWKKKEGRRNIPDAETNKAIEAFIQEINGWAMMRGKTKLDPKFGSKDFERIKTLLREPKNRRLPT